LFEHNLDFLTFGLETHEFLNLILNVKRTQDQDERGLAHLVVVWVMSSAPP
jgi:hypothetical protein